MLARYLTAVFTVCLVATVSLAQAPIGGPTKPAPIKIPPLEKKVTPPKTTSPATLKTYDYQMTTLTISNVSSDRYKLTATVKNASPYDHDGGKVVFSRAGHGESLPAKAGGKVDTNEKWGHKRLGERTLPALKAGQSITVSLEVNGRGDFYAHIEGVTDRATDNNRRDASNLLSLPVNITDSLIQMQLASSVAKTKSRLDGKTGSFEIPGLVSKATFDLPTEAFDVNLLVTHIRLKIDVNDINAKAASLHLENGVLVFRLEYETSGDEVIVGGNKVAQFVWPNVNTDQLKVTVKMPLKFDSKRQLFTLDKPDVSVNANWRFSTDVPGLATTLNSFLGSVNTKIKSSIGSALSPGRIDQIEWNLNKAIRDSFLVDRFGGTGSIDSVTIRSDKIEMRVRTPGITLP